jgi:hypothetical protein
MATSVMAKHRHEQMASTRVGQDDRQKAIRASTRGRWTQSGEKAAPAVDQQRAAEVLFEGDIIAPASPILSADQHRRATPASPALDQTRLTRRVTDNHLTSPSSLTIFLSIQQP